MRSSTGVWIGSQQSTLVPRVRTRPGFLLSRTTVLASNLNIRSRSLDYSHASTIPTATPGPVLAWPSASALLSATMGESGSNPNPEADRSSTSLSPDDAVASGRTPHILIAEDNKSDIFLIRQALQKS